MKDAQFYLLLGIIYFILAAQWKESHRIFIAWTILGILNIFLGIIYHFI
jgi:hypothetical protein